MSLDAKYIFVDVEFLKSISKWMESLKYLNDLDVEEKALVVATTDMILEQLSELIDES